MRGESVIGSRVLLRLLAAAYGTSRTFRDVPSMSAVEGKPDIQPTAPKVRD